MIEFVRAFGSRPLYYSVEMDGFGGNSDDIGPAQQSAANVVDAAPRLAKVRVAGSSPVIRSRESPVKGLQSPTGPRPG